MKSILILKTLAPGHEEILVQRGIQYEQIAPISFEYHYDPEVVKRQMHVARQIVITSNKSLEALKLIPVSERIDKQICVVGESTAIELREIGFRYVFHAKDSTALASSRLWNTKESLLYLCGNLRRDILSDYWKQNHIPFTEAVIYKTHLLYPVIDASKYACILFFSPSAVTSICATNSLSPDTCIGSLGPSTTQRLKQFRLTNVVQASQSTFISLLDTITTVI